MNLPSWFYWGGGLVGAGVIVFLVHKFLGWKWALIAGGTFLGLAGFKGAQERAEERGRAEATAKQKREAEERERLADEAGRLEDERWQNEGGPDPNDPHNRLRRR